MHIAICCNDTKTQPWLEGLAQALPGAHLSLVPPDSLDFSGLAQADYAVVWAPPQAFIDSQKQLKAIFNIGAGVDALMKLRLPAGVPVVRLDDAGMGVQMAEYVCHALIRHFREFDGYEADMAEGRWSYRKPRARQDFSVGVMGLGVLGARVAKAVSVFDFPVHGWSRSAKQIDGVHCHNGENGGEGGFDAFLKSCRVLVNLLPLTPQTEGILNRANLSKLQSGAYLINVARGGHLVEEDLLALLDSGHMAGATLDVFRTEPLPAQHPFWSRPELVLTPHTSARTLRSESISQIAGKIRALEAGTASASLSGLVNGNQGY